MNELVALTLVFGYNLGVVWAAVHLVKTKHPWFALLLLFFTASFKAAKP